MRPYVNDLNIFSFGLLLSTCVILLYYSNPAINQVILISKLHRYSAAFTRMIY